MMAVLDGNVIMFFILRNGERMKVKGNMPIGLVVHQPRKQGIWMDGRTPAL